MRSISLIKVSFVVFVCAMSAFSFAQTSDPYQLSPEELALTQTGSTTSFTSTTNSQYLGEQLQKLQDAIQSQYGSMISIRSKPDAPKPFEKIIVEIEGYSVNLNSSYITWSVNGVARKAGPGAKSVELVLGGLGSVTVVSATIEADGGINIEKEITLRPVDVDLVWEAQSYTPPFYKGKALNAPQGSVVITAIPYVVEGGVRINSANLIYKWSKDNTVQGSLSGSGRNTFVFNGSIISRPVTISVEVTSPKSNIKAVKKITIKPSQAKVLLYEINPLYGVGYASAIGKEYEMRGKELTLIATPYFFSSQDKAGDNLSHVWSLNNKKIDGEANKNVITFRRPETVGVSQIALGVESGNKILQSARNTVLLKFSEEKSE
ncbi:MAG: hypothetical protein U1D31_02970 [Patescibacteria group bacterium]|nr:hypothetical protein [bacterium]MDZ4241055.1 hypothetical protein [Patescibacteria group bacterium]